MPEVSVTTEGVTVLEAQALRWRGFRGFVRVAKECDDARRSCESSQCFSGRKVKDESACREGNDLLPENVTAVSILACMLSLSPDPLFSTLLGGFGGRGFHWLKHGAGTAALDLVAPGEARAGQGLLNDVVSSC